MFTVGAFCESQDAAAAFTSINAVADQHLHVSGDTLYIPDFANLILGHYFAGGAEIDTAYLDAPSLRRVCNFYLAPGQAGLIPASPVPLVLRPDNPLALEIGEGVKAYENSNPAAAAYRTVGLLLGDAPLKSVTGEFFTVKATAAITGVAGSWVNGALTFADVLPVGTYAIVGAKCIATNGVLFRFAPIGAMHRPGGVCSPTIAEDGLQVQRNGRMGEWCRFHTTTPPSLDILCVDACAAQTLYIDVMKVR